MDDLIKRLRKNAQMVAPSILVVREAAEALEALQVENTRLRSLVAAQDAQMQLIAQEREALRADAELWRLVKATFSDDDMRDLAIIVAAENGVNVSFNRSAESMLEEALENAALSAASEGGENDL